MGHACCCRSACACASPGEFSAVVLSLTATLYLLSRRAVGFFVVSCKRFFSRFLLACANSFPLCLSRRGACLLTCYASYRDKYPLNMYLLCAWTFVEAYTVGVVCAAYASQGQVCLPPQSDPSPSLPPLPIPLPPPPTPPDLTPPPPPRPLSPSFTPPPHPT